MIRIVIRINKDLLSDLDQDQGLHWDQDLFNRMGLPVGGGNEDRGYWDQGYWDHQGYWDQDYWGRDHDVDPFCSQLQACLTSLVKGAQVP